MFITVQHGFDVTIEGWNPLGMALIQIIMKLKKLVHLLFRAGIDFLNIDHNNLAVPQT
jgi:hypothetical protein